MEQHTPFDPADPTDSAFLRTFLGLREDTPDEVVRQIQSLSADEMEAKRTHDVLSARLHSFDQYRKERPDPSVGPISIGQRPEPPPRPWTVAGIVPAGVPTILAGHSGIGKSYLTLLLAICVVTGRSFLGRDVQKGNVLWIDRELDEDEMTRRSYAVARGLGMESPPKELNYVRPLHPIGTEDAQSLILGSIQQCGAVLCVLDSLTLGAVGDAKEQKDVVAVMRQIEAWGTSLCIDHITKAAAAGNQSSATIFGSGMKRAIARSTFLLTPAGDGLALRPDKSNFGPSTSVLRLIAEHEDDEAGQAGVVFRRLEDGDPALAGAEEHATAHEKTLYALRRLFERTGTPVSLDDLAGEREVKETTVRNHISKLGDAVVKHGDSTYSPAPSPGAHGDESAGEPEAERDARPHIHPPSTASHDGSSFTAPRELGTDEPEMEDPWLAEDLI